MIKQICWAFVLSTGCSFAPSVFESGGEPDAGFTTAPDATIVVAPAPECEQWSPQGFNACEIPDPGDSLVIGVAGLWTLDTDTEVLVDPSGLELDLPLFSLRQDDGSLAALLSVNSFVVGPQAEVRVTGSRPFIVASWSTTKVAGRINLASFRVTDDSDDTDDTGISIGGVSTSASPVGSLFTGAGSNAEACLAPSTGDRTNGDGGGGGGGAFGGKGGRGGNSNVPYAANGGAGGLPTGYLGSLRGGCAGADGAGDQPGAGGAGGGALQLSAKDTIAIAGSIDVSGRGGGGATGNSAAGGGGGSGGLIILDAADVEIAGTSIMLSHGGGGGEGGGDSADGNPGQDGSDSLVGASGGRDGANDGGDGGLGGWADSVDGGGGKADVDGGGGGGGSVGYLFVRSGAVQTAPGAVISPALSVLP